LTTNRVAVVEDNLDRYLENAASNPTRLEADEPIRPGSGLTARMAVELFEDQVLSRALDVAARELKRTSRSFYTISSAGHENNAVLGRMLRLDDPCLLHYRSGGLMMARSRHLRGSTPTFDTLLSLCASKEDPISHGRHKVWGSKPMWVPPQTSTIASHLPKAVGLAFAIARGRRNKIETGLARDSIVLCSFGDASTNHATALAGFNTARYIQRRGNPLPILFLCDPDLGSSLYEAILYVRGEVASLGADCIEQPMTATDHTTLESLLERAGFDLDPAAFRRYGSARRLYNFHIDHAGSY
jgi:2-oxoisovalerate dehydrogenase E1 component